MANVQHDPFQTNASMDPNGPGMPVKKNGWGCFVWGCLGTLLISFVVMIGSMFAVYSFFTGQVEKYTDTSPAEVPIVEWEPEKLEELEARIEAFTEQVKSVADAKGTKNESTSNSDDVTKDEVDADDPGTDDGVTDDGLPAEVEGSPPPRELILTAEEINALISSQEQLKGKVFIKIEDGSLFGKITIPTDQIPGGKGRYLNADAEFNVSMDNGVLVVKIESASVKGEALPEAFMEGFSQQNLAKDAYNDVKTAEMLRQFDKIEVVDDSIVLRLRQEDVDADADAASVPDADQSEPPSDLQ